MEKIIKTIAEELNVKEKQVESAIKLIDEGNTIPFIARYRKEVTGNLDDEILRKFFDRLTYLRNLEQRKEEIKNSIEKQDKMTEQINKAINKAITLSELEDIYRPFKIKKNRKAQIAKELGLDKLSQIILSQDLKYKNLNEVTKFFKEKTNLSEEEVIEKAKDIIKEQISDNTDFRKYIKKVFLNTGRIVTKNAKGEKSNYDMYYNFSEKLKSIRPHRILAINRGEKDGFLKVKFEVNDDEIIKYLESKIIKNDSIFKNILLDCIKDAYKKNIKPSIERQIRTDKFEIASDEAICVFGVNVKNLLLQAPVKDLVVMGFDPAYRTGCKIAVIDETGKLLTYTTIYPTKPQEDIETSEKILIDIIMKYNVGIIEIGNGTASRESEKFVSDMIKKIKTKKVYYTIVSEAGASVYSASKLATTEYPDINVSIRGAISIARRLQDPLAELVKIDPKSIGVGQYQHDVNQKRLTETLYGVVENVVNTVGVDINTATPSLLSYVSGINTSVSENIVRYREENGKFKNRTEFLKVPKLGKNTFVQCAGFLKVTNSDNILDNTMVHPESYSIAEKLIENLGYDVNKLNENNMKDVISKLNNIDVNEYSKKLGVGSLTLTDIVEELKKPGIDKREDMPKPIFKSDVLKIEDLKEGMILDGTIRNVIDFGAFVDIGIKSDGLVHISNISNDYIKNPLEELSVRQNVKVKVISVDLEKNRVSLSMKDLN